MLEGTAKSSLTSNKSVCVHCILRQLLPKSKAHLYSLNVVVPEAAEVEIAVSGCQNLYIKYSHFVTLSGKLI